MVTAPALDFRAARHDLSRQGVPLAHVRTTLIQQILKYRLSLVEPILLHIEPCEIVMHADDVDHRRFWLHIAIQSRDLCQQLFSLFLALLLFHEALGQTAQRPSDVMICAHVE